MSTHFMVAALRIKNAQFTEVSGFRKYTGYFVLLCLLLHPGLLAIKQFQLGEGLPPASFMAYVGDSARYAVALGSVALLTFLSYEFFIRLKRRPIIARNWKWVSLSQVAAMTLIFIHALRLGQHLQTGWMKVVWIATYIILIPCFYILLTKDFERGKND